MKEHVKRIVGGGALGLSLLMSGEAMAHPSARFCKIEAGLARNVVALKKTGMSLVDVLRLLSRKDPENTITLRVRLFAPLFYEHNFTEKQAAEAVEINCLQMATEP